MQSKRLTDRHDVYHQKLEKMNLFFDHCNLNHNFVLLVVNDWQKFSKKTSSIERLLGQSQMTYEQQIDDKKTVQNQQTQNHCHNIMVYFATVNVVDRALSSGSIIVPLKSFGETVVDPNLGFCNLKMSQIIKNPIQFWRRSHTNNFLTYHLHTGFSSFVIWSIGTKKRN